MTPRVLLVIGAVFALGGLLIARAGRDPARRTLARELRRLLRIELAIVGALLVPALLGQGVFLLTVIVLAVLAQVEFHRALQPREISGHRIGVALAGAASLVAVRSVGDSWLWRVPVILVMAGLLADLLRPVARPRLGRMSRDALTLVYPVLFAGYLVLLRDLPEGFALVAFLYTVVETCDSFALLCGRLGGGGPAFPTLSPGKTWAGVVGGALAGATAGLVLGTLATPLPASAVLAGTGVALAATFAGDLVASKIKRNLGLKDFGAAVTAHGGILDVYDTVLFAAPPFYWVVTALQ